MPYIVYDAATGLIDSVRKTQAEADASVVERITERAIDATLPALTAHRGDVAVPRSFRPGVSHFTPATEVIIPEYIRPPTDTEITRATALTVHRVYYDLTYPRIERYGWVYPYSLKADVEDFLLGGKKAFYIRMTDTTLSHARRRDYASKVLRGPTEITGHETVEGTRTFFKMVNDATFPGSWTRGRPFDSLVWNEVESRYDRRAANVALAAASTDFPSATIPDFLEIDLLSEAWVNSIL